jgi:Domain of unknown function (DUF1772)
MPIVIDTLAIGAALCTAVIFGIDVLAAVVLRPAYREIDDHTLVQITGRAHRFGDQRLPLPGILSVVLAVGAAVAAFGSGNTQAGIPAATGLALLLFWLVLFNRIALPINKTLIAASYAGQTPSNARALQDRWESIINLRSVLQGMALLAFCLAIALA